MFFPKKIYTSHKNEVIIQKIVSVKCPKCNNNHSFYRYGKNKDDYQKYLCRNCNHQFTPFKPSKRQTKNYPRFLYVVKLLSFIMITIITLIIVVAIKNVIILCLFLNIIIFYLLLCQSLLVNQIFSYAISCSYYYYCTFYVLSWQKFF